MPITNQLLGKITKDYDYDASGTDLPLSFLDYQRGYLTHLMHRLPLDKDECLSYKLGFVASMHRFGNEFKTLKGQ